MQENHWTQIRSTTSLFEADMLCDLLHSEGISGLVQPCDASAYLGVMSPCRVLVKDGDVARAAAFLEDWDQGAQVTEEATDLDDDGNE